jgi:hypothetical protein
MNKLIGSTINVGTYFDQPFYAEIIDSWENPLGGLAPYFLAVVENGDLVIIFMDSVGNFSRSAISNDMDLGT